MQLRVLWCSPPKSPTKIPNLRKLNLSEYYDFILCLISTKGYMQIEKITVVEFCALKQVHTLTRVIHTANKCDKVIPSLCFVFTLAPNVTPFHFCYHQQGPTTIRYRVHIDMLPCYQHLVYFRMPSPGSNQCYFLSLH